MSPYLLSSTPVNAEIRNVVHFSFSSSLKNCFGVLFADGRLATYYFDGQEKLLKMGALHNSITPLAVDLERKSTKYPTSIQIRRDISKFPCTTERS